MPRLWVSLTLVAFVSLAFAGCVEEPPADVPTPTGDGSPVMDKAAIWAAVKAAMSGVPCEAPFDDTKTTANLKLLANTTIDQGDSPAGGRELDVRGDLALTTIGGRRAIGIFNISDPLHPVQLSSIEVGGEFDVKFSPDNKTALVGVSKGIAIVDISDPENPVLTSNWTWDMAPSPPRGGPNQNAHMLFTAKIGAQDWVFLAPNSNTGVWIFKLEGPPEARKLTFVTNTLPAEGGPLGPHDMVVQFDGDLETWVLYSADGYHGWTAFDVNDPSKPMPIGGITKPEGGYTHTIQAAKIGNRRIVATIQEVGANILEIYDATNIRAPVLLGQWQHETGSVNPQHNLNFAGDRLYIAHYGNGIFVFDFKNLGTLPLVTEIKPVAHYGAVKAPAPGEVGLGFSQFYDVVIDDGIVYGASYSAPTSGIHVIGDGCLTPGDPTKTSIG